MTFTSNEHLICTDFSTTFGHSVKQGICSRWLDNSNWQDQLQTSFATSLFLPDCTCSYSTLRSLHSFLYPVHLLLCTNIYTNPGCSHESIKHSTTTTVPDDRSINHARLTAVVLHIKIYLVYSEPKLLYQNSLCSLNFNLAHLIFSQVMSPTPTL